MPFTTHSCRFSKHEKVILDGDPEMTCIVTGITIRWTTDQQIEISWIHNGQIYTAWVDESRLEPAERRDG